MAFPSSFVGRYRLLVSDELLAFIERTFVEPAPETERERVRRQALAEAALAELEIEADGTVISRAGAEEFYRLRLPMANELVDTVAFEKAPGQPVTLRLHDANTLVAVQPHKPDTVFVRHGQNTTS